MPDEIEAPPEVSRAVESKFVRGLRIIGPFSSAINLALMCVLSSQYFTLNKTLELSILELEELRRKGQEAEDVEARERGKFTPCDDYQRAQLDAVRDYLSIHLYGIYDKESDLLPDYIPAQDISDSLRAGIQAETFCAPLDEFDLEYSVYEDGPSRTYVYAETLHYQSEGRPGSFTVYPYLFEKDFCKQIGTFVHEGAHIATSIPHVPEDESLDWIYNAGFIAEDYCNEHPPVQE